MLALPLLRLMRLVSSVPRLLQPLRVSGPVRVPTRLRASKLCVSKGSGWQRRGTYLNGLLDLFELLLNTLKNGKSLQGTLLILVEFLRWLGRVALYTGLGVHVRVVPRLL